MSHSTHGVCTADNPTHSPALHAPTHLLHVVNGGDFGALIHVELFPPCRLRARISKRIKAVQNKLKGADAHTGILTHLPSHLLIS